MLLCGLSQAGPSAGLERCHCQTPTRQVRGLMPGAVSCLQSLHRCSARLRRDAWIRGALPFPGDSWVGEPRGHHHPIRASPLSPQALSSLIFFSSPSWPLLSGGTSFPPTTFLGQGYRGRAGTYLERMAQFCALRPSITDSSLTLREARWMSSVEPSSFLQASTNQVARGEVCVFPPVFFLPTPNPSP